ncbi:retrovirus-related pol polyprotein from transposon TNT 1-94 [Tanacetum coccineum]
MQDKNMVINELKKLILVTKGKSVETQFDKPSVVRSTKMHNESITIIKDKVVPNNSQVKFQEKEVEDHHRIFSISKKTKSVTACNDSSNPPNIELNAVCAECGKCVFNSNHDACVSKYLKDVNARTKKPKEVPISASKPKRKANKSVATPHKITVASDTTIQKSKSYYTKLAEFLNKTLHAYFQEEGIEHQTSTPRTPEQNGVVERRNRTLVEAARTMLSASKLPLSFWAEAVATDRMLYLRTDQSSYPLMERRHITS